MPDFSHLEKLNVTEQSEAEYTFDEIWGEPSIWFHPMTDSNAEYLNERVRLAVERAEASEKDTKKQRRAKVLSSDRLEEDRELDRVLMAKTCAIKWGTPPRDKDGKVVEFSKENVLDFLRAIPNYMLDPLRGWIANPYNFVDRLAAKPGWADELGNGTSNDSSGSAD
jgi:hypothetical protein